MTESGYIQRLHRKLPREIYRWKIRAAFTNGVPDCYYSGVGGDFWVEYKYLKSTPKKQFDPHLSSLQRNWLCERQEQGRRVALIVGCPAGSLILPDISRGASDRLVPPDNWLSDSEVIEWLMQHLGCR